MWYHEILDIGETGYVIKENKWSLLKLHVLDVSTYLVGISMQGAMATRYKSCRYAICTY